METILMAIKSILSMITITTIFYTFIMLGMFKWLNSYRLQRKIKHSERTTDKDKTEIEYEIVMKYNYWVLATLTIVVDMVVTGVRLYQSSNHSILSILTATALTMIGVKVIIGKLGGLREKELNKLNKII